MRTRARDQARRSLNEALGDRCHHKIRAPRSLWALMHPEPWTQPTWEDLCGALSLDDVIHACSQRHPPRLPPQVFLLERKVRQKLRRQQDTGQTSTVDA
eukprot:6948474-Pyramimonas_sp.AAC.2